MIDIGLNTGGRFSSRERHVHFKTTAPQPFALASAEPESPCPEFLEQVVQPGCVFALLEDRIVHR